MKIRIWFATAIFMIATYAHAIPVSIVSHQWISKIVDSRNNVTIRPGSVYEISTYFEQIFSGLQPKFKYIFRDTGLGAADPIYPIYQQGNQQSWLQLLSAMLSEKHRHIDHYSKVKTPEGCIVHSAYWLRHIDEFPEQWHTEREQGYTLVDIGFDYYESATPDILCGKHKAHPISAEKDNPIYLIKSYAKDFTDYESLPAELLEKLETKIGLLKLVNEEFSGDKWPRYDKVYSLEENSMWYYNDYIDNYYGQNKTVPQPYFNNIKRPSDLFIEPDDHIQNTVTLSSLIGEEGFNELLKHLHGNPVEHYSTLLEPGDDHFSVNQIDQRHIYTKGLDFWKIKNVNQTISNPDNYQLVSMVIRPYQLVDGYQIEEKVIPQMRFVFQLNDPEQDKLTEQLFIHIMFDGVDRSETDKSLKEKHKQFLLDYDNALTSSEKLYDFIQHYKQAGVQDINFSSSLTGIWVFGSLSRSHNPEFKLLPLKIERQGVDVGYYSSVWDMSLFRDTIKNTSNLQRKESLQNHLGKITPAEYRDPKRHDVHNITFKDMTCSACHQMSGRDGVHLAINDNLDPRITSQVRATEFMIKELARQLEFGQTFW